MEDNRGMKPFMTQADADEITNTFRKTLEAMGLKSQNQPTQPVSNPEPQPEPQPQPEVLNNLDNDLGFNGDTGNSNDFDFGFNEGTNNPNDFDFNEDTGNSNDFDFGFSEGANNPNDLGFNGDTGNSNDFDFGFNEGTNNPNDFDFNEDTGNSNDFGFDFGEGTNNSDDFGFGEDTDNPNDFDFNGQTTTTNNRGTNPQPQAHTIDTTTDFTQPIEPFMTPEAANEIVGTFETILSNLQNSAVSNEDFNNTPEQKTRNKKAKEKVMNTKQGFENVSSKPNTLHFNGNDFTYSSFKDEVMFSKRYTSGTTPEESARSYTDFVEEVTMDIEKRFGGWKRITNMAVHSNLLIINGVAYQPVLAEHYIEQLPQDLKNNLSDGQYAWLFNFKVLHKMTNLSSLMFDNSEFVNTKVRKDLGIIVGFKPSDFFSICRHLLTLQIADKVITPKTIETQDDMFKKYNFGDTMYGYCMGFFRDDTAFDGYCGWRSVREAFKSPDTSGLGKVWGVTWRIGAATIRTGGAAVTYTGGKIIPSVIKGVINFAGKIHNNMK